MKVQIPILNKAAGRSGDTIFQSYYGNTYTRSMPLLFHYPDTEKQQQCQATFFDLQRVWIPIYNQLKLSVKRQQRRNKNPFNVMSSFIYKIFHPYSLDAKEKYPTNFGLDRLNRIRPVVNNVSIGIKEESIELEFDMNRPYNETGFPITTANIILFNITRQSMCFEQFVFQGGKYAVKLSNTNDWKDGDTILFYMALSCDSWLGNFNLIQEWLR